METKYFLNKKFFQEEEKYSYLWTYQCSLAYDSYKTWSRVLQDIHECIRPWYRYGNPSRMLPGSLHKDLQDLWTKIKARAYKH